MTIEIWAAGVPLSTVCAYDSVGWTTRWPGGDFDSTYHIQARPGWRHQALARGKRSEIRGGGLGRYLGESVAPDWDTGNMAATGLIRKGEDYRALAWDADLLALLPTWNPTTAVDNAISPLLISERDAIGWTRDSSVPDLDLRWAADQSQDMSLRQLLDLAAARGYGTPYMGPDGVLRMLPDPTTPRWYVHPDVVDIGEAGGEDTATRILLTYLDSDVAGLGWQVGVAYSGGSQVVFDGHLWKIITAHTSAPGMEPSPDVTVPPSGFLAWEDLGEYNTSTTISRKAGVKPYREKKVDVRDLGPMSTVEAGAIADQALAVALAPAFTSDIPVTPLTVTDRGGQPCNPPAVRAGDLVRVWGASHPRLGQSFIDVIAGEVIVSNAETLNPTAVIKPYLKPALDFTEVFEAALNTRRGVIATAA